ncbi:MULTISPECIES: HD domain-containing protein [unclassified Chelatococcus]|uniref:HD domain-containing protein n=1 Tax=unclassified Chelatococcus TaxID=2638111 RepID=UPI001BCF38DE|nr:MULTISPECIES: HD domain-containing protein [unclassified Chelatococcus]MBS7699415.1 HD domain-containing protein [Chelatococcus sp. YT9]MBX3557693.1 HD domain-containing protein [Chelatococcus sp.]
MMTMPAMMALELGREIAEDFRRLYGSSANDEAERLGCAAQIALECIGRSDALYHNVEHTFLVTLVGRDILHGRMLSERVDAQDYAHIIVACLLHDIGYVRGILKGDTRDRFIVDADGATITLPRGASDAALALHHVDRSKLYARERIGQWYNLDAERVAHAIEYTRFPSGPIDHDGYNSREGRLVQAADLIGQLGDPLYLKKANALFHEFQECGLDSQLGYATPADMVEQYPDFYWSSVSPHLEEAISYLNVTAAGRQWIANLHSHVFCAEHAFTLMGPQR